MEVDLVDAENVEWELHERGKAPDHVDVQRNLHHVVDLGGGGSTVRKTAPLGVATKAHAMLHQHIVSHPTAAQECSITCMESLSVYGSLPFMNIRSTTIIDR